MKKSLDHSSDEVFFLFRLARSCVVLYPEVIDLIDEGLFCAKERERNFNNKYSCHIYWYKVSIQVQFTVGMTVCVHCFVEGSTN